MVFLFHDPRTILDATLVQTAYSIPKVILVWVCYLFAVVFIVSGSEYTRAAELAAGLVHVDQYPVVLFGIICRSV